MAETVLAILVMSSIGALVLGVLMSNSVAAVLSIDTNYDLHIARILVLLGIVLEKENERCKTRNADHDFCNT